MIEAEVANNIPDNFLPLLPLKNVVILPKSIIPIIVGRPLSIQAVEQALKGDRQLFITTQKDQNIESPVEKDLFSHGTRSTILQVMRMPNGSLKILAEGICRAKITQFEEKDGFISVKHQDLPTTHDTLTVKLEALWRQLQELYLKYAKLNDKAPADIVSMVKDPKDMDYITDTVAMHIEKLTLEKRQAILELPNLQKRMLALSTFLKQEISILQTEQKIRGRVQIQVEKSQKEYYLHEQIKAIQKELGREDLDSEMENIKKKVKGLKLPNLVTEKVNKEIHRLEQMPALSSEAVVSRHFIDWIISLPWLKESRDTLSLSQAEHILNKSHAGLKKSKERIIEFLAAKKFSKNLHKSPIICLVGPPGVGKTSLVKSIAQSLGRKFVRISLGGVRDEAEIRGHRRTYVGSLPGKIIQAMKKAGTINPVILLDEIDKMSRDMQGDPAAALLEVLDPEQNASFVDHFLEVDYDLSKVMFIATANIMDNIPYPLFDRLEIISLSGYTSEEKIDIAKKFLIPKNLKEYSLNKSQFILSDELLIHIINEYTKEAGIRQLDRIIAKLMRKTIQHLLKNKQAKNVTITNEIVLDWLGHVTFRKTNLTSNSTRIGIVTGLAWTEVGGDVLEVETSVIPGKGGLTLTGQLGDVMQESAHTALTYIRSRSTELGIKSNFYTTKDFHVHIPEGATPKDGPSAGITMCVALISAFTENPVKNKLAMTGEITLQGRVLGVGGLKEKLLAAQQYAIEQVIVPQENFNDIEEIKKDTNLDAIKLTFVSTMDEVLQEAFVENPYTWAKKLHQKAKSKVKTKKTALKKNSTKKTKE
ncbi:MAG: endopeptidase La [Candidatus Dependentiae bacterium]|nr:endopeptidase La [Candidatus Dependentiae bacterium]